MDAAWLNFLVKGLGIISVFFQGFGLLRFRQGGGFGAGIQPSYALLDTLKTLPWALYCFIHEADGPARRSSVKGLLGFCVRNFG